MKKEVTLVLVPFYPKKLEAGMLMAYKRKKLEPEKYDYNPFYLTQNEIDVSPNITKTWMSVKPFLICDDDSDVDDLFIFSVNGRLCDAYFDDLLGPGINWVKKVIGTPKEIGILPIEQIRTIITNGKSFGKCEIEMQHTSYNPDHNGECLVCDEPSKESCTCKPKPKLLEGKVAIFILNNYI